MLEYDENAWQHIDQRRKRRGERNVVPARARELAQTATARGVKAAGTIPAVAARGDALTEAARGAGATVAEIATASISERKVLLRYERHGHELGGLGDIRSLSLEICDSVFPNRRRLAYMLGSGAQGGVAGAGSLITEVGLLRRGVAGAGARAVPGPLALAGILVADAAATLGTATRVVAETAAFYGYDPQDPDEELFMVGVLGVATAGTQVAKTNAHRELNHVARLLTRRASKAALSETNLASALTTVWPRLIERLTHRQMGIATPALGIALGFGVNASLMRRVADEAYYAYRERRLIDRYGVERQVPVSPASPGLFSGTLVDELLPEASTPHSDDETRG